MLIGRRNYLPDCARRSRLPATGCRVPFRARDRLSRRSRAFHPKFKAKGARKLARGGRPGRDER